MNGRNRLVELESKHKTKKRRANEITFDWTYRHTWAAFS